jgi:BirA family biotin operon repressor/biotin-[acetyl-CoA-carboxylase] ligase
MTHGIMRTDMPGQFPGSASFYVESTSSTMDDARELSIAHPYGLVRAGAQSAGRGRLPGRQWTSDPGESLLVTLWFPRTEFGGAPLPLLAGLAVVRACVSWAEGSGVRFGSTLELKWPNDVLCGGRKLAGILCEASGAAIFAGIGINCAQASFEGAFRTEPTSIRLETGAAPRPDAMLERLATAFYGLRGNESAWKAEYEGLLAWKGRTVEFRPGISEEPITGTLSGIDASGAVVIASGGAHRAFPSGEISIRY